MFSTFKLFALGLIVTIVGMAVSVHASADRYKGYELPPYTVLSTDGDIELRRYAPHLVAEVDVEGRPEQAVRKGFRILADFIFGGNIRNEKVEMTVPVTQVPRGETSTIRFMMPAAYTLDSLPRPDSSAIRLVETPGQDHLVLRFSGRATPEILSESATLLLDYARAKGHVPGTSPQFHFYDDPFTLPWKRRNEVSLPIS